MESYGNYAYDSYGITINENVPGEYAFSCDKYSPYFSDTIESAQSCSMKDPDPMETSNSYEPPSECPNYKNIPKKDKSDLKIFSDYTFSSPRRRTDSSDVEPVAKNKIIDENKIFTISDSDERSSGHYKGSSVQPYITSENKSTAVSLPDYDIDYVDSEPLTFFPPGDHSIKRAARVKRPNPFTFTTPLQSWKRVFEKYSPSTEILHSPVKHIEANILPNVTLDKQLLGLVWVCSMSEQFYYDNTIILLQKYYGDELQLRMILMMNSRSTDSSYFLKNMVDVNVLGSGTFGDVYRVKRKGTDDYFAVKYLKKTPSYGFVDHTETLISYLKEKNFLLQARKSPYVVQFITSRKFPKINGLFLFFEWCLCDLRKYINLVNWNSKFTHITEGLWYGTYYGIAKVFGAIYPQFEDDLYSVSIVYIFEIFCAISFLADCNLVHQDLKPENIMISTVLHLKIGDFGLAYNTKFVTRKSQLYFIKSSDINLSESSNYGPVWGGTPVYEDMELCYRYLKKTLPQAIRIIDSDQSNFKVELMGFMTDADPDFLSDLWACGIMALELLLGGLHIFQTGYMSKNMISEIGLTGNFQIDVLKMTYNEFNNERYIEEGLRTFCGDNLHDLTDFIASIFLPRTKRSVDYRKEKEVYRYKKKLTLPYIDINKVESIDTFSNYGLHKNNAFLYNMPPGLTQLLSKPMQPKYSNLKHLLQNIVEEDDNHFFDIAPGIEGMFF